VQNKKPRFCILRITLNQHKLVFDPRRFALFSNIIKLMVNYVIKSNKEKEPYQKEKIINSLRKLNISQEKIDEILFKIDKELPEVVSTKKLFQFIFENLKAIHPSASFRFNLKQAIFKLGPAGYSFEKFIAHLFKIYGYKVKHIYFYRENV